jgi:hypothetical protein
MMAHGTSLLILGGYSTNNSLNEHIYKVVQDSSGHVHSFLQIKSNAFRSDELLFKISSTEVAVLCSSDDSIELSIIKPEESLSTKKIGQVKVSGVPKSVCLHDQFYYLATQSANKINVYKASLDLSTCQQLTTLSDVSAKQISFIATSSLHLQVNENLYLLDAASLKLKGSLQTVVNATAANILHIKLVNNKMTVIQTKTADYSEEVIGELLEVLPRVDFSGCKVGENKFALFGGRSPNGETLSDIFTFTVEPPDPIGHYTHIWAAKFKIFSLEKKKRITKFEQEADKACTQNNYIKAAKLYEGLSKACPSFDYYFKFADALIRSKTMNEISHFQAKIEVALQLASEYVQNYDQKVQVDEAKARLASKLPKSNNPNQVGEKDLSASFKSLAIQNDGEKTSSNLQSSFESALAKLDQVEAIKCLIDGVRIEERYKSYLNKPNASIFIQQITEKCCSSPKLENWAIWFIDNFSSTFKSSSLLRLAIIGNQRKLVDKLLQLNLTYDINQNNSITKDDQEIAELAAKKDFPSVIKFCYHSNRLHPINKVVSEACKFASEHSFNLLLDLKVHIDGMDAIQKCISHMSIGDSAKRMKMIEKIIASTDKLQADQILCAILKRYNFEWFGQIFGLLQKSSLAQSLNKSMQPLKIFLEELYRWDIDDVEPIMVLIGKPEHLKDVTKVLDAIFANFNENEDEDLVVEVFRVMQEIAPNVDFIHNEDNLLRNLLQEDLIEDSSVGIFFKFLVAIGFSRWKMMDVNRRKLLERLKRIASSAKQETVKKAFSSMPAKFIGVLLLDLLTAEANLSVEAIKLAEVVRNYGKVHQLDENDRKQLLQLAQGKNISSIVEFLKIND